MAQLVVPALHGLTIWWASTCLILFLDGLPQRTFRWSMTGATIALGLGLYGLWVSAGSTDVSSAYIAFTSAVTIWGWLEASFYMGYVTGPRKHRCEPGCHGWRHFGHAILASLYHEIAVLVLAAVVLGVTWSQPNQFGTWTFIVLWWMHQSARLNVFLGVSNLNAEFLPDHLDHIRSFLNQKPMNLLFPFSVTGSTIAALLLFQAAASTAGDEFAQTGFILLTTIMVLAILEHWFLVMPISATSLWNGLWQWSLASRGERGRPQPTHQKSLPHQATIGGRP